MYFHKTPGWLKLLYPTLVWNKSSETKNNIYLTFDDGPISGVTDFVLDILRLYNAKATFFCVGDNIIKNPSVFEKILVEGHSVGNHSRNHLNGWKTKDAVYVQNIAECNEILDRFSTADKNVKRIFRPPYGKITRSQIKKLNKDYQIIMWDVLSGDFDQRLSKELCLKRSIEWTTSGSIIVFHDNIKTQKTVEYVLPLYLDHFSKLNYNFLAL